MIKTKSSKSNEVANKKVAITFAEVSITKWNRSYGMTLKGEYLEALKDDIEKNSLIQPVVLVRLKSGSGYGLLAGAHRVEALKQLRGADRGLYDGEFQIMDDLDEDNPKCLDISISENRHRHSSSVYDTARYVARLTEELKVDQGKISEVLGIKRPNINRLLKLDAHWSSLPDKWRDHLSSSPDKVIITDDTTITFSHWYEAASYVDDGRWTDAIVKVMEDACAKGLSTRQFKQALKDAAEADGNENGSDEGDGNDDNDTNNEPAKPQKGVANPVKAGERIKGKLNDLITDLDATAQYGDAVDKLKVAAQALAMRHDELKAEAAEVKAKAKAAKASKKTKA